MRRRPLLVALLLVLGGCGSSAPSTPPIAGPTPSAAASTRVPARSADPCAVAIAHLSAFASQLGAELATLRPKVTDPAFDSGGTSVIVARVAATLRAFDGLEARTAACSHTASLVGDVATVRLRASSALDVSSAASINDGPVQREAATQLFDLLATVQHLATGTETAAHDAGLEAQIAKIPDASTKPIGSLPPLATDALPPPVRSTPGPDGIPTYDAAYFGPNSTVTTYRVTGSTPREIGRSILANGPLDRWLKGRAEALTLAIPHDKITFSQSGSACRVTSGSPAFSFSFRITLPRWTPPPDVPKSTVTWWITEIRHVATHENHHVDLWRTAGAAMSKAVAGSTCTNLASRLQKIVQDTRRENCEFDMKEYGEAMGLSIESCLTS